jgi:hypothetical protein
MEVLEMEVGAYFFDNSAETINNFLGEEVIGRKIVGSIINTKGDKRVNFSIHNPDSDYSYELKTIESGKDYCIMKTKETKKQKKGNK